MKGSRGGVEVKVNVKVNVNVNVKMKVNGMLELVLLP